jgi:hypothetical protein
MSSRRGRGRRAPEHHQRPRGTDARAHTFRQPVLVTVRIEWAEDGVEQLETEALGWTDRRVYVRLPDSRWRFTSVWLRTEDVKRR